MIPKWSCVEKEVEDRGKDSAKLETLYPLRPRLHRTPAAARSHLDSGPHLHLNCPGACSSLARGLAGKTISNPTVTHHGTTKRNSASHNASHSDRNLRASSKAHVTDRRSVPPREVFTDCTQPRPPPRSNDTALTNGQGPGLRPCLGAATEGRWAGYPNPGTCIAMKTGKGVGTKQ
jgi:hypothetical protein